MKHLIFAAAIIVATSAVQAEYVRNTDGEVWRNSFGECWTDSQGISNETNKADMISCGDAVAEVPAPVVAPEPAPVVVPKPAERIPARG